MTVMNITKENFQKEVLEAKEPVLVDFWAAWCGPCRMMSPVVDEIAEQTQGVKVCKVNVDEQQELAVQYGVMTIPTLIVFENGKEVNKSIGVKPKQEVLQMLGK